MIDTNGVIYKYLSSKFLKGNSTLDTRIFFASIETTLVPTARHSRHHANPFRVAKSESIEVLGIYHRKNLILTLVS